MTIRREDLDRQRVDFSDVASGERLSPIHPGEILRERTIRSTIEREIEARAA